MARSGARRSGARGIPKPLRPIVGGLALVGSVRLVDTLWRRVTGRPIPTGGSAAPGPTPGTTDEARLVRDRVLYSLLLGGAMRVARRLGLPKDADTSASGPDQRER